ncbi:hypothetical protein ACIBCM_20050 [Streptomyces sp. NPDC051018]|uniref:hypothetical protein n=1 Tax=Streptomyces sp. NPDC051018 TaxID=3365639 RepID=UPI00379FE618
MSRGSATTAVAAAGRTATGPTTAGWGTTARGRAARSGGLLVLALAQVLVPLAQPAGAVVPGRGTSGHAGHAGYETPGWAVPAYETDPGAQAVKGATAMKKGPLLRPGTYTDTISAGERKYYRVDLDAISNAYVSAVLAPPPGSEVAGTDGIRVTLESADRQQCSDSTDITFGGATARPVADYSTRRIGEGRACQEAGQYLYTVEWIDSKSGTGAESWPVELKFMSEPGLKDGETAPPAPSSWSSGPPGRISGEAGSTKGGSGFNDAPAVGRGVWRDRVGPGESRFYKVPVDWGQQLFLDAEFGGSGSGRGGSPAVADGLRLSLFNTARGFVESADAAASGSSAKASLGTAPVAFANRSSDEADTGAMRFAGWYYIRVSVDERVGNPLPLTLRVAVEGEAGPGPAYDRDEFAAGFGVLDEDRQGPAASGGVDVTDGRRATMRVIGLSGVGTGTALVLGLVVWTLRTRRRASPWEPPAH